MAIRVVGPDCQVYSMLLSTLLAFEIITVVWASLYWDGRVTQTMNESDLDSSIGPYLTLVPAVPSICKGAQ